ncbi:hypothetical protein COHA_002851 [Chlorella ohadii]|uniref:Fe2OG dioxygenase domain-containing protein n=1 Tax=Chlorella ohadii TaxID=2649997 RepID=A0AAD5DUZ0_9CHLO|nr:hypothetical protein COHA_002851 [Chlorella ohadii]
MAAPSLGERLCALLDTAGHADADAAAADAPTTFVCSSPLTRTNPGLEVSAAGGRIALPLQEDQAAALKAVCSLAPFGQGEATVTDTAVRHTWQLDPSAFQLTNPRWEDEVVPEAVRRSKAGLGIHHDTEVDAQLYKLLLYEPGSHFKPHRDSPKGGPGVFGTLTILLPSAYEGGQLVVRHGGNEVAVDMAARNAKASCFAAFYADCEHEILPVTAGHRLCLIYDLVFAGAGPPPPTIPGAQAARLADLARDWAADPDAPMKLLFVLSHRYSEQALRTRGVEALRPTDRAAVQASSGEEQAAAPCLPCVMPDSTRFFAPEEVAQSQEWVAAFWPADQANV